MYQIKSFVSNKGELLDKKVNEWLEENKELEIIDIIPIMSYTSIKDKGAMMIGCMIKYEVAKKTDDIIEGNRSLDDYIL